MVKPRFSFNHVYMQYMLRVGKPDKKRVMRIRFIMLNVVILPS